MMYRYLPTPSDRMGIIWTLLTVKDAVVLEYGPAGTTHFSVGTYGAMGLDTEQRIFTTHLGESDVIMGDTTRLEEAIVEIDENYEPKIIFVVSSAVVSIIGTDMKGICHYMQKEVKARLIPIETGGFKGDYSLGLKNGWNVITKELCKKGSESAEALYYNILGASPYNYRIKSDVNEIKKLMRESFSMEANVVLGMDATLSELENMGKACINLVIQEEALNAAEYMKENFGIPYIYGAPFGYKGTKEWLNKISKVINKEINFAVIKELQEKIMECQGYRMYTMMFANRKMTPSSVIVGEFDTVEGIAEAMSEVFLPVAMKVCNHSTAGLEAKDVLHPQTEKEKIDLLKRADKSLVFGDDVTLHIASDNCTKVIASAPTISRPQIANHLPFMGIRGMDYLLEQVETYYNNF